MHLEVSCIQYVTYIENAQNRGCSILNVPEPFFFAETFCSFFCCDIMVTETFHSFVSHQQLHQNLLQQCSLAYIFRHSDHSNDLIFLVISKTFQSMTEKNTDLNCQFY